MAGKVAGTLVVKVSASSAQFLQDMQKNSAAVRNFSSQGSKSVRDFTDAMRSGTASANRSLETHNAALQKSAAASKALAKSASDSQGVVTHSYLLMAEAVGTAATAFVATAHAAAAAAPAVAANAGAADTAVNAYRVLRLALSPTMFTAASLAAGYLIEKSGQLAYAQNKVNEALAQFAVQNRLSISDVQELAEAAKITGANMGLLQQAVSKLGAGATVKDLGDQLKRLGEIQDPVQRVSETFQVFGAEVGEKLLPLLNERLATNTDRIRAWGITIGTDARENMNEFARDLHNFVLGFKTDADALELGLDKIKLGAAEAFASLYKLVKSGYLQGQQVRYGAPQQESGSDQLKNIISPGNLDDQIRARLAELSNTLGIRQRIDVGLTTVSGGQGPQTLEARAQAIAAQGERDREIARLQAQTSSDRNFLFPEDPRKAETASLIPETRRTVETRYVSDNARLKQLQAEKQAEEDAAKAAEQAATEREHAAKEALKQEQEAIQSVKARINLLNVERAAAAHQRSTAGGSESERLNIDAMDHADKVVAELNNELVKHKGHLDAATEAVIRNTVAQTEIDRAEAKWRDSMRSANTQIEERIRSQELLTAAIGKGAEASRAAAIEQQLMSTLGPEKYFNRQWMADHQQGHTEAGALDGGRQGPTLTYVPGVDDLRKNIATEQDAQRATEIAKTVNELTGQVDMERALAAAERDGASAVQNTNHLLEIKNALLHGASVEQITEMQRLFDAQRNRAIASEIDGINAEIAATNRLAAAYAKGTDEIRRAQVENQINEAKRVNPNFSDRQADALRNQSDANERLRIAQAASDEVHLYSKKLEDLEKEEKYIQENTANYRDQAEVARALRDIEDQRLKIMVQQQLAQGDALSGVRAFFTQMRAQAQSAADIIYQSLNKTFDGLTDNLTNALLGEKTHWAQMFQEVGHQLVHDSVKNLLQQGIALLGEHIPILGPVLDVFGGKQGKPDGTDDNPFHVLVDNQNPPGASGGAETVDNSSLSSVLKNPTVIIDQWGKNGGYGRGAGDTPGSGSGLPGFLQSLGSGIGSLGSAAGSAAASAGDGLTESVSSSISFGGFMAAGGNVTPGDAYMVGERGPEMFYPGVSGRIMSHADSERAFGGGNSPLVGTINVPAGVDVNQIHLAIYRGMMAAQNNATVNAVRAVHDQKRRTP